MFKVMGKKLWFFAGALIILLIFSPIIYSDEIKVKEVKIIEEGERLEYAPNEVLVKFKTGILPTKVEEIFNDLNVTKISEIEKLEVHRLNIPERTNVSEVIERFKKNPFVEFAEPNYYVYTSFVPNDPIYCLQWHLDDSLEWDSVNEVCIVANNTFGGIHMESAWDITTGDSSVIVAVLDTGVAYEDFLIPDYESNTVKRGVTIYQKAPDLAGTSFVAGFDFINNDSHPNDNNAHGTHVTGTVAQTTNNNLGVGGIAFDTTIMPIKVLDYTGSGTSQQVADGIIFATDNGADIISMSLGSSSPSSTIESAVNYAFNNNVTVIAACGNSNSNGCDFPAAFTNVISVGATQYDETKAPYSSFGSNLDLVAPGGNTGADQNGDDFADGVLQQTFESFINPGNKANPTDFAYWFFQGTSMATPHVAGVAALLLALNSSLTPDDIRNILTTTADDLGTPGRDNTFGHGLVNAFAAVDSISPPGEFISITLHGYPIDFSNKDPNTVDNPGIGNFYTVSIDSETTVNVDLYQKGDDFAGNPSILGITNMSWFDSNDSISSHIISTTFQDNIPNISPNTNVSVYYWLDIPANQTGGSYNTTINIKAVETGISP